MTTAGDTGPADGNGAQCSGFGAKLDPQDWVNFKKGCLAGTVVAIAYLLHRTGSTMGVGGFWQLIPPVLGILCLFGSFAVETVRLLRRDTGESRSNDTFGKRIFVAFLINPWRWIVRFVALSGVAATAILMTGGEDHPLLAGLSSAVFIVVMGHPLIVLAMRILIKKMYQFYKDIGLVDVDGQLDFSKGIGAHQSFNIYVVNFLLVCLFPFLFLGLASSVNFLDLYLSCVSLLFVMVFYVFRVVKNQILNSKIVYPIKVRSLT